MKTFAIAFLGFLFGILAAGAAGFWALQSGLLFPDLVGKVEQPVWPDVRPEGNSGNEDEDPQVPLPSDPVLPVPKGVASEGFQQAFESTILIHNEVAGTGALLVDKLREMNERSLSRNFDGFFDLVFETKTLLAEQERGTADLTAALSSLERELPTVADPSLAAAVKAVVAKGRVLTSALTGYSKTVDVIVSGKMPGQADVDAVYAAALSLRGASEEFNKAVEGATAALAVALEAAPILRVNTAVDAAI